MEAHPLNLAHQQQRRAEAHLINNRYDDAMQCHHNAAELLLDAMKTTASSVALESITLQHSYHLKQKDLIKSKKEQFARIKKAMDNIKWQGKDPFINLQGHEATKLQIAIYRAINETDSLLHALSNNEDTPIEPAREIKDVSNGKKVEKSQKTVVEELHILSQNLHSLVEQLVLQVEVLKDENVTLKERVNYLEKERVRYLNLPCAQSDLTFNSNLSSVTVAREVLPDEVVPMTCPSRPTNNAILERPSPKPHFDLSALKND